MARKAKITTDKSDRKDQRKRTTHLKDELDKQDKLPVKAPKHLNGEAKKLWETLVPVLNETGYIVAIDSSSVETLVMNYQMLREAYESIKKVGIVYQAGEKIFKNPAVSIIDSATKVIKAVGGDLGLSPQSRTTLIDMAQAEDEGEDLAAHFMGGA